MDSSDSPRRSERFGKSMEKLGSCDVTPDHWISGHGNMQFYKHVFLKPFVINSSHWQSQQNIIFKRSGALPKCLFPDRVPEGGCAWRAVDLMPNNTSEKTGVQSPPTRVRLFQWSQERLPYTKLKIDSWMGLLEIWSKWLVQPLPETTPLKINGWNIVHGGLEDYFPFFSWVICKFQSLIFQGVFSGVVWFVSGSVRETWPKKDSTQLMEEILKQKNTWDGMGINNSTSTTLHRMNLPTRTENIKECAWELPKFDDREKYLYCRLTGQNYRYNISLCILV